MFQFGKLKPAGTIGTSSPAGRPMRPPLRTARSHQMIQFVIPVEQSESSDSRKSILYDLLTLLARPGGQILPLRPLRILRTVGAIPRSPSNWCPSGVISFLLESGGDGEVIGKFVTDHKTFNSGLVRSGLAATLQRPTVEYRALLSVCV